MFIGGAAIGPALSGDGGDGGVFPVIDLLSGDGGGDDPALELSANRTQVTLGERVTFTVLGPDGEPARNATVAFGGNRYQVDERGQVEVRVDRAGDLTAEASAAGENGATIGAEGVAISVAPRVVDLGVRANRLTATVGEPIAFTLVREDTGGAVRGRLDATHFVAPSSWLEWGPVQRLPGKNGTQLVVVPERPGMLSVVGTRQTSGGDQFREGRLDVVVERRTVGLTLEVDRSSVRVDESVSATVQRADTGEPVAATIEVGDRTIETGPDGEATLSVESAGRRTLEATASPTPTTRFTPAVESLSVRHLEVDLALEVDRNPITDGGRIVATVTRTDTGEPVEGTVSVAGRTLSTGEDGQVATSVDAVGEQTLVATAPNTSRETFVAASDGLTVTDATLNLSVVAAPATVAPGEQVSLSVRVANEGPSEGSDTIVLRRDDRDEGLADRVVTLEAGNATTVTLSTSAPAEPAEVHYAVVGSDVRATVTVRVEAS